MTYMYVVIRFPTCRDKNWGFLTEYDLKVSWCDCMHVCSCYDCAMHDMITGM